MPPDPDLANAGRAGLGAVPLDGILPIDYSDDEAVGVAQAVLDALGFTLDGWEWGVRYPSGRVDRRENEGWARQSAKTWQGAVQRRRKVTTEWMDAE